MRHEKLVEKGAIEQYGFNRSLQEKAKRYWNVKFLVSLLQYAFLFVAGFLTLELGISVGLERFALNYTSDPWLVVALYFLLGFLCFWLVSLPFDYYKGYVIEHKFELSTQTGWSWFGDQIKSLAIGMILLLVIVEVIYYTLRTFPVYWWVYTGILLSVIMIFMMYIGPVLIMPLFFKYTPLKNELLISKLTNLAKKAGIKLVGVYEMKAAVKTKKAVGGLTGVGNTRRIILSDTLLSHYTSDEIEVVIGHELGHHIRHVYGKITAIMIVALLLGFLFVDHVLKIAVTYFGLGKIESIATLPLLALSLWIFFMALKPILNTFMRREEREADQYTLEITNKPDAFTSMMVKGHDQNLKDADPHPIVEFLFHEHPAGKKRVEHAITYKKSM
jgi:STE24 endopeptidase